MPSVSRPREQATAWGPKLENEPLAPIFIVSPPVYLHTAFLDDFFGRSFPYTQAETTSLWRTRDESSPLSKETARVCAEISTSFTRRVPDPRCVRKEPCVPSPPDGAVPG
jgi:hypothetical protein